MNSLESAWARQTGLISGSDQNESFWHLVHRGSRMPCASDSSTFHMPTPAAGTDAFEMGHYPKEQTSQPSKADLGRQAGRTVSLWSCVGYLGQGHLSQNDQLRKDERKWIIGIYFFPGRNSLVIRVCNS